MAIDSLEDEKAEPVYLKEVLTLQTLRPLFEHTLSETLINHMEFRYHNYSIVDVVDPSEYKYRPRADKETLFIFVMKPETSKALLNTTDDRVYAIRRSKSGQIFTHSLKCRREEVSWDGCVRQSGKLIILK